MPRSCEQVSGPANGADGRSSLARRGQLDLSCWTACERDPPARIRRHAHELRCRRRGTWRRSSGSGRRATIWSCSTSRAGALSSARARTTTCVIDDDPAVSRVHAVLEHVGPAWCITDVGSTNGTCVNGERLFAPARCPTATRSSSGAHGWSCATRRPRRRDHRAAAAAPARTPGEQRVLVELCRPVLSGQAFTSPSSVRAIAEALFVTESAVKQHLDRLYDKFGIHADAGVSRRGAARQRGDPDRRGDPEGPLLPDLTELGESRSLSGKSQRAARSGIEKRRRRHSGRMGRARPWRHGDRTQLRTTDDVAGRGPLVALPRRQGGGRARRAGRPEDPVDPGTGEARANHARLTERAAIVVAHQKHLQRQLERSGGRARTG